MKQTLQTKLDEPDYNKLAKVAKKEGHTLSSLVRHIIKKFLKTIKESV